MMKIGLIDADLMDHGTRHPNLALMKISGYYKGLNAKVELIYCDYLDAYNYDEVFISKVFTFSNVPDWILELPNIHIGGTGFFEDGGDSLPDYIEHHKPDYDLYKDYVEKQIEEGRKRTTYADYLDYSIGFTTRGCFRKCAFCVNKKYDRVYRHSTVQEFYDDTKPFIYLWDDNILAFPKWEEIIDELETTGKPFQFRQGIDLRLMTDRKAYRFNHTHYHGDFIFAFDHLKDKELIIEKVQLWKRYSSRVCKMYVLSGFDSQDEKDIESVFERISVLMKYGSVPYIMRYEKYKTSKYKGMYIELARWCNQPQFFKKKSFREFCVANQEYKKDQSTNCAAYQTMLDFEAEFPEIAERYFDLRFDKKNIYTRQYGYGRRYENKPLCSQCKKNGMCWEKILSEEKTTTEKFIGWYLSKEIDLQCMLYENSECSHKDKIADTFINALLDYSIDECIETISQKNDREKCTKENIPQFGNDILDRVSFINKYVVEQIKEVDYDQLGKKLKEKKGEEPNGEVANKKYGENHAKLAALLDIVVIGKSGVKSKIYSSLLGEKFYSMQMDNQSELLRRLVLRIPIVQEIMISKSMDTAQKKMGILASTTRKRRTKSVTNIIEFVIGSEEMDCYGLE